MKIERCGFAVSFEIPFAGLSKYVFQWVCAKSLGEVTFFVAVRYFSG